MIEHRPHHDAAHWAGRRRDIDRYTVRECRDIGDSYEFLTTGSTGFVRSKQDVGAQLQPGDVFELETIGFSHITGLAVDGVWRFRMTDEDLAAEARKFAEDLHRRAVETLEVNKAKWWAIEEQLPDWIRARINRFRDAAGEKFLLEGWGYELVIAQLAVLYADGDEAGADELSREVGASGNQVGMARALAQAHIEGADDAIARSVSGLGAITGSADYS